MMKILRSLAAILPSFPFGKMAGMALLVALTAACSEGDDTVTEEYPNWQQTNESYFEAMWQQAQTDSRYQAIPKWSLAEGAEGEHTDYIVVEPLKSTDGTLMPMYTDSVTVHYSGRLLPSTSYALGYEFDKSYAADDFDASVAVPSQFYVAGLTDGFATALQHMHRGERWRVIVPYQLGYGFAGSSAIPGYSTLVFTIELVDFWHQTRGDRKE